MTTTRVAAPTASWRNRITGSGEEAPDQLLANPANWRIHPKAQQDALAGALDAVGWVQQVLVNRSSGFVVDGHARVALALSRGEPTVPVLYVDLAPEEEALVLATLDPIGAMAGRDDEKLKALLADVTVDDAGLLALLGDLGGHEPKAGLTDPDEVPEPPEEPSVKPGELWRLGSARFIDRLPCERRGTLDSSLSRATTSTASPRTRVASGQSRGSSSVVETTVVGRFLSAPLTGSTSFKNPVRGPMDCMNIRIVLAPRTSRCGSR